jgi:predicted nucleic acid-binding protein
MLDTSAYAAFMRGHPDLKFVLQEAEQISMSPIVLGELHAGFRLGNRRA